MEFKFTANKVPKIRAFLFSDVFSVKAVRDGTFAIASSTKECKSLMKSDADVITYERKGFLYLNDNGPKRGWGKKGRSGLLAKFKGKPKLSSEQFSGLYSYKDNLNPSVNYGKEANIKDQIAAFGGDSSHV